MLNKIVKHNKYGKGTILEKNQNYLKVQFESCEKVTTFLYPDAFEKFLVFEDENLQEHAIKDFNCDKEKKETELLQKRIEYQAYKEEQEKERLDLLKKNKKLTKTTTKKIKVQKKAEEKENPEEEND